MSDRGHNTKISKRRLGCRLPYETAGVGDGYAASSPVETYTMSEEEILRRYGHAKKADWKKPIVLQPGQKGKAGRPKKDGDEMAVAGRRLIDAARDKLSKETYLELMDQGMTDGAIAKKLNLDHEAVKRLKREYKLTVPGQRGRQKKEDVKVAAAMEVYPGDDKVAAEKVAEQTLKEHSEPVMTATVKAEKLSITKLLELRELLDKEIKCHEEVDDLINGLELSPGVKDILTGHWDECQNRLDRINKVFDETTVQL